MDGSDYDQYLFQKSLNAPMPWIGMYVAAASLVCTIAMAGDVIHGIWRRKFWFPCKFFPINATSLTVLAVGMKLPMDLTTPMVGWLDLGSKVGSEVFMIIVMGNFLISVASRNNDQSFMNSMALGILVVTIVVDVGIQQHTWSPLQHTWSPLEYFLFGTYFSYTIFSFLYIVSMVVLLVTLSSLVLTNPTTKRYMEEQYNDLHETACEGRKLEEIGKLTHQKLKEEVEKYWVMVETGSPQFVMARSVTSVMSGAICLFSAFLLIFFEISIMVTTDQPSTNTSYGWSTTCILSIQSIGVVVGIIAPLCRWFVVVTINCNNILTNHHHHKEFKLVEHFWIQRLVEWKETPLPSQIRGVKCKKVLRNLKLLILNLCIFAQIGIVVANKLVQLISIIIVLPFFSCFYYYKKKMKEDLPSDLGASTNDKSSKPRNSSLELDQYVLRLEGEAKLPKIILKNICRELHQVIQKGKSGQPNHLVKLLQRSNNSYNYKGVAKFESARVSGCWTMPVVNLTCIAIALPNTENHVIDGLISSVSEGLLYANLVEESFISEEDNLLNMKRAAAVVWADVELYRKWLEKSLRELSLEGKTIEGTLQTLVHISEKVVIEFQSRAAKGTKALAANSMYEISQAILKDYEGGMDAHGDGHMFEQLSVMIADILRACLSNLPRVIIQKCYCIPIEEREKSVRHAAHLLGETEEILKILGHHQLPCSSEDQATDIEEGHPDMMQKETPVASGSGELHIDVAE